MATYNSVTFKLFVGREARRPHWERAVSLSNRNIPYADQDDLQYGGLGNWKLTLTALVSADADIDSLQASVGLTKRTLNVWGTNYSNSMLLGVSDIRRMANTAKWWCKLVFQREGT